ncbi:MAG: Stk1 family PASTA domain-containing Ser/Thr kinase [Clostridia bacterium]|nr:Stk1 family PASTA domain-containing Ser/Thr kinase [Clostridia bacterium]
MKTLIGRVIGNRYELVEKLGGGGMAIVYKGKDRLLSRAVTIKILREQMASDAEVVRRFQQEAQAVAKLSHPNIVSIYDVGQEQDLYYLVMEYIEGRTLKEIIQEKGRLEPEEAIGYARQLCDALQHAHDSNIIHRDIKPQNILITNQGQAKVTDFGIAKAASNATMTYSGSAFIGTVQYISPEQARGDMATIHTDIYSAGIVLYEMLTGQLPFEGDTAIGIAIKHIQADYPKPSSIVPDLPIELEQVITKALAKKPQDRFHSAMEMKKALEQAVDLPAAQLDRTQVLPRVTDSKPVNEEEFHRSRQRSRKKKPKTLNWVLFALAMLILLVGGFYYGFQRFLAVSEVEIPDVTNMPLTEAERTLLAEGLKWEIGSRMHNEEVPKDHVLSQKPAPGEKIKLTRAVVLDVSLGPNLGKIPDVIGFSLREARVQINNAGFEVAEEIREEYTEEMAEGYILRQIPGPYEEAPVGSEVTLIVSLGPQPRYIGMPDLLGKTLPEATQILEENYLELGEVTNEVSYDYFAGQVVSQDIAPGEQVLQKTAVNLSLSLGPGPASKRATVQVWVQDDGEQHRVRVVIVDQTGEHEEYNAIHDPNDFISIEVPYYGKGHALVYEDDVLIKETTLQ